ncbi:MAG: heme utilization cystosolic carrier protein HutX [Pseudomonadota bacterium]
MNEALKNTIDTMLADKKTIMLAGLAHEHKVSELEVAQHLPADMVAFAPKDAFEGIWDGLSEWEKATFLVQHLGSVFEICGKVNKGTFGHGYYNLKGEAALHGHMKVDDLACVGFLSVPFMGLESHCVVFFNEQGDVKFSVYVGREKRKLIPEILESFKTMKQSFCGAV